MCVSPSRFIGKMCYLCTTQVEKFVISLKKEVWAETRAIVSCNDGLRPEIMKLEATEEEAMIDYTPIER